MEQWKAYYEFEPFGAPAEDERWRFLYQLQWHPNFKGDMPDALMLDRDPEETARIRAEAAAKITMEDKIDAFFGAFVTHHSQGNEEPHIA